MTAEQLVRDQLDRATRDVPNSPDLETAIRQGRRRRLQRRGGAAIAAVAVLGIGTVGLRIATADDVQPVAHDAPVAEAPALAPPAPSAPEDFVAGTDIDEALVAVVAAHLPYLPAPDDVYPSDSHTAGPMPDADFAQAEDWQAAYTLGGGHEFLLMTALASEGPFSCQGCEHHAVPGGEIYRQVSQSLESGKWQYATWYVRGDGSTVGAFEYAPGQVGEQVPGDRALSDTDLEALVQDPRLSFTRP